MYEAVPFRLALIGFEVSGDFYAEAIAARGEPYDRSWMGFLWPKDGVLRYYPREPG